MKVKKLEETISDLYSAEDLSVDREFVTQDNSRVDLAVHHEDRPLVAVEFEESYKWMRARVLYDAIKAEREGFPYLAIVYQFEQRGLRNGWIWDFIDHDLDVEVQIVHPNDVSDLKQIFPRT